MLLLLLFPTSMAPSSGFDWCMHWSKFYYNVINKKLWRPRRQTRADANRPHLLQNDTRGLVDGSSHSPVPTRVADEGPRQHGHHDHAQSAVTHQGEGGQADKEKHARQHVEEAHQDKQHGRCAEGAEEIFWLL